MLNELKLLLSLKGFSVHLQDGKLSVSSERRDVEIREVKKCIPTIWRKKLEYTERTARYTYVVLEEA